MELGVNNEGPLPPSAVFVFLFLSPSLCQLFPWRTSLFAISSILSYRRNRTHVHVTHIQHSLSLLSQVHPVPQTRPRSVDPFRLVLSPALLLAVEIAVTNHAWGIQEIRKRALPFARSTQGKRIEGRTCKPISSWRSILGLPYATVVKQSEREQIPGSRCIFHFIWWFIYRLRALHATINYLRFAGIRFWNCSQSKLSKIHSNAISNINTAFFKIFIVHTKDWRYQCDISWLEMTGWEDDRILLKIENY